MSDRLLGRFATMVERTPIRRLGEPKDVARF
jgi:hypothetical protein